MGRYSASRMKSHQIERMWKLIDALDEFTETKTAKFDMGRFFYKSGNAAGCGTACCAFGLAATLPLLKKAGLSLTNVGGREYSVKYTNRATGHESYDYTAAGKFFGINEHDVQYLFSPDDYARPTKSNVLRRLISFVENQERLLGR